MSLLELETAKRGEYLLIVEDTEEWANEMRNIADSVFDCIDIAEDGVIGWNVLEEYLRKKTGVIHILCDIDMPSLVDAPETSGVVFWEKIKKLQKELRERIHLIFETTNDLALSGKINEIDLSEVVAINSVVMPKECLVNILFEVEEGVVPAEIFMNLMKEHEEEFGPTEDLPFLQSDVFQELQRGLLKS